jgi:hypothetical protein
LGDEKGEDESKKKVTEMVTREMATCDVCGEEFELAVGHKCKGKSQ